MSAFRAYKLVLTDRGGGKFAGFEHTDREVFAVRH